jgi:hypothetical protein
MKPATHPNTDQDETSTQPSILIKSSFYIIIPYSAKFSKRSPSFRFHYRNYVCISLFSHACYIHAHLFFI